ncbi:bifunctional phosphoglucose/phosphomannose isomerase [Stygiolobus caldivivus]|uniref:Phosphomannose isomerase n=1 Tax=Stygiolobus caldivivus TaxID=2824673 RepID=A0A8D5ZE67_9CREN|nr:bifunctional phosphoglucose/phosphomannose isomerase [Stygiolobus caldivivus]BCU69493.1 phosphomannose isomerase [Stygiolobus caldivivus]
MNNPYEKWVNFFSEAIKAEVPEIGKSEKIAYFGIGGSGIPGEALKLLNLPVHYEVFRGYKVRVDEKTTVFAVSYSGNTTETLVALKEAERLGVRKIAIITGGGKILELAKSKGYPVLLLPNGLQTRYVFPFIFTFLVKLLNVTLGKIYNEVELLEGVKESLSKVDGLSSQLASEIKGKIPVFYASELLPIAERFKQEVNENAKYPAFFSQLPEANHNEIELYSEAYPFKFQPIVIPSDAVDEKTAELIGAVIVRPFYSSPLKLISSMFLLAGFTSVRLADLLGVKPEQLRLIPKIREMTYKVLESELK